MFLRLALLCVALFAVVHAKPGVLSDPIEGSQPGSVRPIVVPDPFTDTKQRTLALLLPLLFPSQFALG
ncbi:uncharacterized protein LOC121405552 [Drosophila obscura]|uniref:uncharacterized protein LOC121405552 n=1 Tax=Drosophila obscura TaxID=7282 RepID=UPI001BB1DD72|nr:uncharacterized protein LOC121405552 [Drosophila obscura]